MNPRAYYAGEVERLPAAPPAGPRRPWFRDAPVFWRKFRASWQLVPSVWVCLADLHVLTMPARQAMWTHDPYEEVDAAGVERRYVRCSRDVWRRIQAERQPEEIAHVRDALAACYTLEGVATPTLRAPVMV